MKYCLVSFDIARGEAAAVQQTDRLIEAPNWHPNGRACQKVSSGGGFPQFKRIILNSVVGV